MYASSLSFRFLQAFSSVIRPTDCTFNLHYLLSHSLFSLFSRYVDVLSYRRTCVRIHSRRILDLTALSFIFMLLAIQLQVISDFLPFTNKKKLPQRAHPLHFFLSLFVSININKAKLAFQWMETDENGWGCIHKFKNGILNIKYHTMQRRNSDIYFHFLGSHQKNNNIKCNNHQHRFN